MATEVRRPLTLRSFRFEVDLLCLGVGAVSEGRSRLLCLFSPLVSSCEFALFEYSSKPISSKWEESASSSFCGKLEE